MEATNIYGHALAAHLVEQGQTVSIVNPSRIKGYAQSQLSRTKNDRADAKLIAHFCRDLKPHAWQPLPESLEVLQCMARRWQELEKMITQESNRKERFEKKPELRVEIEAHIKFLKEQKKTRKKLMRKHFKTHDDLAQQRDLLTSIPSIAEQTAMLLLAELGDISRFRCARQVAAFAGLTPRERLSGTSVRGKSRLSKLGNRHLRRVLYYPALTALRCCEPFQMLRSRLLAAGKTKMQAVGAVMHKLSRVVFGVLKSGTPFEPDLLITPQHTPEPIAS
ncbi:MAG: IS110 family transposase [Spirulina sp. SIO3F2]|nr:IS110 family transposase [Spirulina sp. SIO3F2]